MDFMTDAFNNLEQLQEELGRLHQSSFASSFFGLSGAGVYPPINGFRDREGLVIHAELPGLTPDAITVSLERRRLTISGERMMENAPRGGYHRRERAFGKFSRTVTLPEDVDVEQATAQWRSGVLTLRVPPVADAKPRQITVQPA